MTLVPRTYSLREDLVDLAVAEGAVLPELAKDRKKCERAMKRLGKWVFECEDDATGASEDAIREPRLHRLTAEILREVKTLPRRRCGRPRKGDKAPTRTVFRVAPRSLEVDPDAVEHARTHAPFFVLATDHLDRQHWRDTRIFAEYRHQHIIEGHTGFRWLKGPAAVAPRFLKTPRRIAALGLVFVLALMVRNYIQWALRRHLAEEDETLPKMNDQPSQKPTTESAFRCARPSLGGGRHVEVEDLEAAPWVRAPPGQG